MGNLVAGFTMRWRLGLLLVALAALASSLTGRADAGELPAGEKRLPRIFNYELYLHKYRHNPGGGGGPLRLLARMRLFLARTVQIFKHNALYASNAAGHYLQQNMFTDLTPGEIVSQFVSKDDGLELVAGARAHPDMSAEAYAARALAAGYSSDDEDGSSSESESEAGYGRADLSGLAGDHGDATTTTSGRQQVGPDFLHERERGDDGDEDEDELNLKGAALDLQLRPRVARRVARLLAANGRTAESLMVEEEARRIELARRSRGIVQAPIVAPNNKNFDASLLPSQGLLGSVTGYLTGGALGADWDDEEDEAAASERKSLFSGLAGKLGDFLNNYDEILDFDEGESGADGDEFKDARDEFEEEEEFVDARGSEKQPGAIVHDIDWRQTGCISQPKHQVRCNSCYAFATLDLMEFFYCRQKKTSTEFSAQYVVDCGHKSNLNGCKGGKLSYVGMFIRTYGLQLNALYPYQALDQQCPFDETSDRERKSYVLKPKITGWRTFNDMTAWYKWLPKTPIVVGINMPSDFLAYGGGVHDGLDCAEDMGHAMLLVGSGKQDGKPFWLLKNSYSRDWGEAGYFRLSKRAPLKCFKSAIVARVDFNVEVK